MGGGNDSIILGEDFEAGTGTNTLFGGDGTDTLLLNEAAKGVADAAFTNWSSIEIVTFAPGDNDDTLNLGLKAQAAGVTKATVEGTGSNIDATNMTKGVELVASGSANDLTGGAGSDTLTGGAGVNIITTGAGNDTLAGGAGADDFIVNGTAAQTVSITDFGTGGGADSVETSATATTNISVVAAVTVADDENKGTTNVTITDDVVAGGTVTFAAVDGAAVGEKGFNINSTANNNSIAVVGGGLADTIVAGTGDETLNGSAGADTITGGTGKDDFLLYNMGATDVIKDFTVSQTDQFGVDLSDMEAQALTDFVGLDAASVAADQAMNTLIVNATAAVDLNGTDTGKEIAVFSGDYADETGALLQADIRANLTVAGNFAAGDAFLGLYDNGTDSFLVSVETAGGINNALFDDADVIVLAKFAGVADATTIVDANILATIA